MTDQGFARLYRLTQLVVAVIVISTACATAGAVGALGALLGVITGMAIYGPRAHHDDKEPA